MLRICTVFGIEALDFELESRDLEVLRRDLLFEQQAPLFHGPDVCVLCHQDMRLARLQFSLHLHTFST